MKGTYLRLFVIACYKLYAYASPLLLSSISPTTTSKTEDEDALKPITIEVTSNGIVIPSQSSRESGHDGAPIRSQFGNLEDFPVIQTDGDFSMAAMAPSDIEHAHGIDSSTFIPGSLARRTSYRYNPYRIERLRLERGPVVKLPRTLRPTISAGTLSRPQAMINSQPIYNSEPAYIVIPFIQYDWKPCTSDESSITTLTLSKDAPSRISQNGQPTESPLLDNATHSKPLDTGYSDAISPTISRCLNILRQLRVLAEHLVYVKVAPYHTLMSACHFQSLNRTQYNGRHVERMREICWDLFETIQLEGRRRWERCISKAEDRYRYNSSAWQEGGPQFESDNRVDKFNFHAYQLTPGSVREFIAEHPDLSPDDIEWLLHDTGSTDTALSNHSNKEPVYNLSKRSWLSDLLKTIIAAEINTAVYSMGSSVQEMIIRRVQEYQQKTHSHNGTYKAYNETAPVNTTSVAHSQSKRDPQSNRVLIHSEWFPMAPVNNYVNQPRDSLGIPFSPEDISDYLEFVSETTHLSRKQYRRLKDAVEYELKLNSQLEAPLADNDALQSRELHGIEKRSGPPPKLGPTYRFPYQWNFPPGLDKNPAYVNLTRAWKHTVTAQQKAHIGLQLRNVWALRASDLCNISRSWTKNLSEESQEMELKFKGLSLQRCQEFRDGKRENTRVGEYWRRLGKQPNTPNNGQPSY
ncbi:hypothetical protein OIDMADRAFT_178912 [Oidiodendron maius Zn]|uniref:Uncharacterized protein n=1 Tax=Oidiodendron maius (strain Zn) TaxID=913774 RepID=A0A0C3DHW4_OIDMZ|nr:hypothetical protein OIDMADRAFT_178912 [Oidiodendron maius Zn]